MNINTQKRYLIYLLCGVVVISLVVFIVLANKKMEREQMEFVKQHKEEWIDLLTNSNEVLPYLERFYFMEDELIINYRNGELTINEPASNEFSFSELEKLEELFKKFQWETIRLLKKSNDKQKVLEIISSQMKFGKFFAKHYCTAVLVYSPNDISGEEIFPNWYYKVYFET